MVRFGVKQLHPKLRHGRLVGRYDVKIDGVRLVGLFHRLRIILKNVSNVGLSRRTFPDIGCEQGPSASNLGIVKRPQVRVGNDGKALGFESEHLRVVRVWKGFDGDVVESGVGCSVQGVLVVVEGRVLGPEQRGGQLVEFSGGFLLWVLAWLGCIKLLVNVFE